MKCFTLSIGSLLLIGQLFCQIPSPDTLTRNGSIEMNGGSLIFLKTNNNPLFKWQVDYPKNQIELAGAQNNNLLKIDLNGNTSFGSELSEHNRFKLTISSPGDGDSTYSIGGDNPAAMLKLVESKSSKFGRIHFNNLDSPNYWQIQTRSSTERPEVRFYYYGPYESYPYYGGHTVLNLKPQNVTINGTNPKANLHIVQSQNDRDPIGEEEIDHKGLGIENFAGTALWRLQVGVNDLALIFNETHMGSFSSSSGFYNPSDRRLKNNISPLTSTLEAVLKLQPATYFYNHEVIPTNKSYGFVAQDVKDVFPNLVVKNEINDLLMINYDQFIPILTKSIQELKQIIDNQQKRIAHLERKNK